MRKRTVQAVKLCIVMVVGTANIFGTVQSQSLTFNLRNVELKEIFQLVEKNSDYRFLYRSDDISGIVVTRLNVTDATVDDVMRQCLTATSLTYEIDGDLVILKKAVAQAQQAPQGRTVSGRVMDADGKPIVGVAVMLQGTSTGITTDANGQFTINVGTGANPMLRFSFLGYEMQTIPVRGQNYVDVTMLASELEIEQVVVTGYQTLNERESASAVSKVKAEEIMVFSEPSIEGMLQGKLPGVMVSMTSDEPSATPKIRIRGNATINGNKAPVWVVDGIIIEDNVPFSASDINSEDAQYLIGSAIAGLNPQDIEDITVLKDASATAIYGVRAANGVIVVRTKRGGKGAPQVRYSGSMTINTRPDYRYYDRMNSQERVQLSMELMDAGLRYSKIPVGDSYEGFYQLMLDKKITDAEFANKINEIQARNTDWFKLLFQSEISHNHTVNVSGGGERSSYYFSGGYTSTKGAAKGSLSERYTALAKADFQLTSWLDLQVKLDFNSSNNEGFSQKAGINPFNYAYNVARTLPAYNDDGTYHMYDNGSGYLYNMIKEKNETGQEAKLDNFNAMFALKVKLLPGLYYQGTFSFSNSNTNEREWMTDRSNYVTQIRKYEYGAYDETAQQYESSRLPYGGILNMGTTRKTGYTVRNTLEYRRAFNSSHEITAMAGVEANSKKYKGNRMTGYGWNPLFGEVFMPVYTDLFLSEYVGEGKLLPNITNNVTQIASFFGTFAYTYKDRYVLNGNIRSDGSNKFGSDPKYRWLPTWSVAGKWIMSNEPFLKDVKLVNNIAIRGSYGLQGSIHDGATPNLITQYGERDGISGLDLHEIYRIPNPSLRWEKTASWNVAVDFSLWDHRVRGSFDVYGRRTKDLIQDKSVPTSTGVGTLAINSAKMENRGFEGFVNVEILRGREFEWRAGVNFSRNRNEVTLANMDIYTTKDIVNQMLAGNLAIEGDALGSLYSFVYKGLSPEYGYPYFTTAEGDLVHMGEIDLMELVNCGSIYPDLSGGFDMQFTYKRMFSLAFDFAFNLGDVRRLPAAYNNTSYAVNPLYNASTNLRDRWKKPGDEKHTDIPALYDRDLYGELNDKGLIAQRLSSIPSYIYPLDLYNRSDYRVAPGDFLKLRTVTLSYTMPHGVAEKLHVKGLNVRFQMSNVFILADKKWKGLDPESSTSNIPILPKYNISLDFTF